MWKLLCSLLLWPVFLGAQPRNVFVMQNDTTRLKDTFIAGNVIQNHADNQAIVNSGWIGNIDTRGESRTLVYWAFEDSLNLLTYKYVKSATLSLWQSSSSATSPDSAGIRMITRANQNARTGSDTSYVSWTYTTVTDSTKWNALGAMGSTDIYGPELDIKTGLRANWGNNSQVSFNVTDAVQAFAKGQIANKGFIIYVLPLTWAFGSPTSTRGAFKTEPTPLANGPMIRIEVYGEVNSRAQGRVLRDARGYIRVPGRNRGTVINQARRVF